MSARSERYEERARQLLLPLAQRRAFVALNDYADDYGYCPSCGTVLGGYERERLAHAQRCRQLQADSRTGWACTSCHTTNGPDDTHCVSCGRRDLDTWGRR